MTIELVVETADREREVGLRFQRGATGTDLAAALVTKLELDGVSRLFIPRLRRWIEPQDDLSDLPLVRGDRIWAALDDAPDDAPARTAAEHDPREGLEVVVVGGPAMGAAHPLQGERVSIGRGRDCDMTIDDAAMSRTHLVVDASPDAVRVSDAGSTNGTFVEGVPIGDAHEWQPGQVIEAGASLLSLRRTTTPSEQRGRVVNGTIPFNRPPRVHTPRPKTSFEIPAPPREAERPRLPLIAAGVPLLFALLLWWLLPDNPTFLVLLALSPLVAVFGYIEENRRGSRASQRATSDWHEHLDALTGRIQEVRTAASELRRASAPGVAELHARATALDRDLWLRRVDDEDFLALRFGWGDAEWDLDLQEQPGGSERLRQAERERVGPLKVLSSVPLTFSLRDTGAVGIAGDRPAVEDAANWWIAQIATLHSPADVSIVVVPPQDNPDLWSWTRWLPHAAGSVDLSRDAKVAALTDSIVARTSARSDAARSTIVAVLHERAHIPPPIAARLLREGPAAGICVVWAGSDPPSLPGDCRAVVEVTSESGEATLTLTSQGARERGTLEGLDGPAARQIALALAPVVDAATGPDRGMPSSVTLFELVGDPSSERVRREWERPPPGLRALIGHNTEMPVAIDLVGDGPHALIGGMTGSGKSELLQTVIASLAATYPPPRLNFLLIDYKGGAAFKECVRLPHVVGFVTDLDGDLARRALAGLEAEVRRREQIFSDAGIRDIAEVEETDAAETPPRLVLVIDELATLVKELPSFVDGLVDIAQRGRSLGLHLMLATQRPAGVITDAVRANTNLRIALRVADDADSADVIGTPAAARIPRAARGRGFVKKGVDEIVEVQIARASAPTPTSEPVEVWDLDDRSAAAEPVASAATQLDAFVDALVHAARGYPGQRSPWVAPLPDRVPISELPVERMRAAIGLVDEPHLQRQRAAIFDLDVDGGLAVYGTGGAGKTTLLTAVAASLARGTGPDELHLYGLDMTGGGLKRIESLPHCGGVVDRGDVERVRRLLSMLQREIDRRRSATGDATTPRLLTLIDGYAAFASAFERVDLGELVDLVPRLISDGRSLGVHFVVSGERRGAIPGTVASSIPRKIVLRLGDDDDYAAFGLNARDIRGMTFPPGRGFIDGMTFQAAAVGERDLQMATSRLGPGRAAPAEGRGPARVQTLPKKIAATDLPGSAAAATAVFGIAETDLAPVTADLRAGHFLVSGPYRSGRSTALATLARGLAASTRGCELHLLAPRRTGLADLDLWTTVAQGAGACEEAAGRLARDVESGEQPSFVFVDDADELTEGRIDSLLLTVAKRGRDGNLRLLAAGEARTLQRTFAGWLLELRKDKQGLLLDPDLEVDGDLLGVRLPRRSAVSFPPGRGYLASRGRLEIVQVACS